MKIRRLFGIDLARAKPAFLIILGAAIGHAAMGASLSELMEKGIYSEETKGDLDSAMQIYKQVVSEAKAGQSLAAQAVPPGNLLS